jgi:hypothetical protein
LVPAPFQVVLDANVLFPFTLRDTLLRAAEQELYLPGWSRQILEEMRRNLVKTEHTTEEKSHRLVAQMMRAFPEAEITGYEYLVSSMPNEPKDRHVAAAAVRAGSQLIVTDNLRDFQTLPEGMEAKSPDNFLCDLLDLSRDQMVQAIIDQAAALKKPPRTVDDILRGLQNSAPTFVRSIEPLL